MNQIKKISLGTLLASLLASSAPAGQFTVGAQGQLWTSNYQAPAKVEGAEFWVPVSFNVGLGGGLGLYAMGEFGNGAYTSTPFGVSPSTTYLAALSDTVAGGELNFKSFGLPSLLNIGFNLPTGDPTWEAKQIGSNLPTDLVDSRYRGRGFGISGMYAISFPAGSGSVGAAAGYQYAGNYNPVGSGLASDDLKLGDSIFLALNHVQPFSGNQSQVIRLSGMVFTNTNLAGSGVYQLGPNVNGSYSWNNPNGFSFDLGGQLFLAGQRLPSLGTALAAEANAYYGPRIYLNPSYSTGAFRVAGRLKYVFANGYDVSDALYQGGGYVMGLEPSYRFKLSEDSGLRFSVSYDNILAQKAGVDINGSKTDVQFNRFTVGTNYEVKL